MFHKVSQSVLELCLVGYSESSLPFYSESMKCAFDGYLLYSLHLWNTDKLPKKFRRTSGIPKNRESPYTVIPFMNKYLEKTVM